MPGEFVVQVAVKIGREIRVFGVALARLEEKRAVGSHLVNVVGDVGIPLPDVGQPVAGFFLGGRHEVAVEVKPVVIKPATGPYLVVFAVVGVGHEGAALVHIEPVGGPVAAIGVEYGFDMHNGLIQHLFYLVVFAGG